VLARQQDPIVAIATAPGRGAVGIVRVSGPTVVPLVHALCGRALEPRVATYLPISASDGGLIDKGLALHFPAPHSYTGEDVLELQIHGGSVVLQLLVDRVLEAGQAINPQTQLPTLPGMRLATPGEFTQRAFLSGKIDLVQAEAIADLIDASTEAAARGASRSLVGEFSREIGDIKTALVCLRMLVEATLDFPEEDIDFLQKADARGQLLALQEQLAKVMQKTRQGALLRDGIKVVIAGQPNAGKSSLLNALAGAELAIVTPVAGTTRDKIQQTIQISGVPVHVVDTAGLRDSDEIVEKLGIERAWEEIGGADAVVFLHDLTRFDLAQYADADQRIRALLSQRLAASTPIIDVWNKADIADTLKQAPHPHPRGEGLLLSAKTGAGLAELRAKLLHIAGWQAGAEGTYIARARHVRALNEVAAHLAAADLHLVQKTQALDLLAEELRLGQNALSEILGEFTSDDLLGVIFSSFCIGK
jgi:tRNA modification GTPase